MTEFFGSKSHLFFPFLDFLILNPDLNSHMKDQHVSLNVLITCYVAASFILL